MRPADAMDSYSDRRRRASPVAIVLMLVLISLQPMSMGASAKTIDSQYLGSSPGRYDSIKCGDIDDDGNIEMVFSNTEGALSIVEATGGTYMDEWQSDHHLGHRIWGLALGDVDGDDMMEIVIGGQAGDGGEGLIMVLDAKTRKVEWKAQGEVEGPDGAKVALVRDLHGIEIADPDMDGETEIVVGSGYKTDNPWGFVYIFNGRDHRLEAIIGPQDSRIRGVEVADIDEDGKVEVVFGTGVALGEKPGEGYIRVYEYDAVSKGYKLDWLSPDMNGDIQGLIVTDVDGDGRPEMVATAGYRYREGYVYVLRHLPSGAGGVGRPDSYEIVWQSDDVGPKPFALAVGDIDGDGVQEIVTGNQPGYIWVFDGVSHKVEWKSELLGTDVFGLEIYDIDKDGQLEIIAAQGGYIGKADWTSGYSAPHIYIIDGSTHAIEASLGEPDYLQIGLQAAVIILILVTLWNLNRYVKRRRRPKDGKEGKVYKDKVSRRRGVR
jgi:hypothetical protein